MKTERLDKVYNDLSKNTAVKHQDLWVDEDFQYLVQYAGELSTMELAIALGRTYMTVQTKASSVRISLAVENTRRKNQIFHNGEQLELITTREKALDKAQEMRLAGKTPHIELRGNYFIVVDTHGKRPIKCTKTTTRMLKKGNRFIPKTELKIYWEYA